ncbi:MAG: Serine phosphatase RsbU, regulator of sigma subunit [uncultured Acidimicrobiales bacterium]|uniref:Serine phosphatase RsbU, regulator of sigma subunit n=1 Tax=uncultured Acidimicrobiales bacterium TaxID=310071 RepID=A0A6J4HIV7_9ACTN|nr:MAG: Serine phosphatase RsbU, regulator of sigma subunit [uncultured Acidimicrobiales bacterium]
MTEEGGLAATNVPFDDGFYAALVEDDPQELYDNAPCGYVSTLPDGTIVKVNETLLAWTGYHRDALVGRRRLQELLPPGDRIFYETHFSPLLRMQGKVREIAVQLLCQSGRRLPVLVNSVLTRDAAGAPRLIRTAIFDATERRAYEEELLSARRRAEESEARATALASTLQASFLPPAVVSPPWLDIGGAYRPAGDGSEVGGDFYDVFETGRGTWAIALGDVCGKGVTAAVVTALARYTLRAEALRTPYPSAVLAGLHDALLRYHPDHFCTALFVAIDHTAEGIRLNVASGGHHLPLRRRADGRFDTIGGTGTILGMLDRPQLTDSSASLEPGDVVVLYTDGVTEGRRDRQFFDEERLLGAITDSAALSAQEIADAIVASVLDFQHGDARDDMAVVVIKVP